jgi:hypothetical protein
MSTHQTPYPHDFQIDYHADRQVQRTEAAFNALDAGDVLATVDDLIRQEPDPAKHPLYDLTMFLLDRTTACDGGHLYDALRAVILLAIDRCLSEALSRED